MKTRKLITLIFSFFLLSLTPARAEAKSSEKIIQVIGEGKVQIEPDEVVLRFGIETANKNLRAAKDENVIRTKRLLQSLKKHKIPDKKIKTSRIQINPRYRYDRGKRNFQEYSVRKDWTVTLTDLSKYGKVLNTVLEAGVEYVSGGQFQSSKSEDLKKQARKKAVYNAKKKAQEMAGYLGKSIGEPVYIEEIHSQTPIYRPYAAAAALEARSPGSVQEDVLSPGEITVKASVKVHFELK